MLHVLSSANPHGAFVQIRESSPSGTLRRGLDLRPKHPQGSLHHGLLPYPKAKDVLLEPNFSAFLPAGGFFGASLQVLGVLTELDETHRIDSKGM